MALGQYKEYVVIALAVGAVFGGLYLYTGVWPPIVVVESNSMMHVDPQEYEGGEGTTHAEGVVFGRLGTLDPGDLVLLKEVDEISDIQTYAHTDEGHYGKRGDVIAYTATPGARNITVIHRAITYVSVRTEPEIQYIVDWTEDWTQPPGAQCVRAGGYRCVFEGNEGVSIPELGMFNQTWAHSGFITKGDNIASNPGIDQAPPGPRQEALKPNPVRINEIRGKAQGEIPGIGLLKLAFTGDTILNAEIQDHRYYLRIGNMVAPFDLWMVLGAELVLLSVGPVLFAIGRDIWRGRSHERVPELSVLQAAHRDATALAQPMEEREKPPAQ